MKHYIDNSIAPIIAIDFDGTINYGDGYPNPHYGKIRPYAKEVMNFLYAAGIKVVIWTNRKNIKDSNVKDKLYMKQWLKDMDIKYNSINDTTKFAPYKYYGRKIYAHMFVDDRGFGWKENTNIMLFVLSEFLSDIVGIDKFTADNIALNIKNATKNDIDILSDIHVEEDLKLVQQYIKNWNRGINK